MPEWSAAADLPECRLMEDPVDSKRTVDWGQECILALQEETAVIMSSGSGRWVHCLLQPGTSVVVDSETADWLRITACSNEFPRGFSPGTAGALNCVPRDTGKTRTVLVFPPPPEPPQPIPTPPQIKIKKKKKAWPWIVVGVVVVGAAVALSGGGGSSGGGPAAPDPNY